MSTVNLDNKHIWAGWTFGIDALVDRIRDAIEVDVRIVRNHHPEGENGHWQEEIYREVIGHTRQVEVTMPPPKARWADDAALPAAFECSVGGIPFRVYLSCYMLRQSDALARYEVEEVD